MYFVSPRAAFSDSLLLCVLQKAPDRAARIPLLRCPPLLLWGFCPRVGWVGLVCVAYKNTSRPFRAADPAHVPEVLFAVEKHPRCYHVESCRVVSCRVELHVRWKSGIRVPSESPQPLLSSATTVLSRLGNSSPQGSRQQQGVAELFLLQALANPTGFELHQ